MNNLNPRFDHAVGEKIALGDAVAGVVLQVMDRDAYTSDDPIGAVFLSSECAAGLCSATV